VLDSLSRPIERKDFFEFDWIVGMSDKMTEVLRRGAPKGSRAAIYKMTDFIAGGDYDRVPDPYFGGEEAFELVLDLLESASQGLLARIVSTFSLRDS
jgi:protein-tyrosine phosphatase